MVAGAMLYVVAVWRKRPDGSSVGSPVALSDSPAPVPRQPIPVVMAVVPEIHGSLRLVIAISNRIDDGVFTADGARIEFPGTARPPIDRTWRIPWQDDPAGRPKAIGSRGDRTAATSSTRQEAHLV
jgi:hypothetical protein